MLSDLLYGRDLWNDSICTSRQTQSVLPSVDLTLHACRVSLIPKNVYEYKSYLSEN